MELEIKEKFVSGVRPRNVGLLVLLVLCSIFLFFGPTDNWSWDPSFYYAQLRSPIIDGDLDLSQEVIPAEQLTPHPVTGLVGSVWPMGVSISWSPFFLAAHIVTLATSGRQAADGLTPMYIAAVGAGSALYGLMGVLITYRICRMFARRDLAALSACLVLLATPLFFYVYRQPLMGHTIGMLVVALLLYSVIQIQQDRIPFRYSGLLLGTLVGLSTATRWIGATTGVFPALLFLMYLIPALRQRDWPQVRAVIRQMLIAGLAASMMLLPQLALWHRLYDQWLRVPVPGQLFTTRTTWLPPYIPHLFVHTNRGLLYWAPLLVVGMIGLFRVQPIKLRVILLSYLAAYCYVLGSFVTWHGGGGYGARYFIESLPVLAVGFVVLLRDVWSMRWGRLVIIGLGGVLIMHQLVLVTIVEQGWLPLQAYYTGEPLGLRYQWDGLSRLVEHPGDLLLPRPKIAAPHQTAITNLVTGPHPWTVYQIPLVACVVIGCGLIAYHYLARLRFLPLLTGLIIAYMLSWFWFLLIAI